MFTLLRNMLLWQSSIYTYNILTDAEWPNLQQWEL